MIALASQASAQLAQGFPGLCGLLFVMVAFCLTGALLSRDRSPLLMVIRGWALATVLAMLLPFVGFRSLTVVLAIIVLAAIAGAFAVVRSPIDTRGLWPAIVVGLPLILLSTMVPSTYWDSYTHWLPNASYLFETDQLISAPLPQGFYSRHPTYPPALALPVYFASRLTGHFASGAAQALGSVLVVLAIPRFMIALSATEGPLSDTFRRRSWTSALLVLGCLILLNPAIHNFGFAFTEQGLHYWSVLADSVLAIVLLVAIHLLAEQLTLRSIPPSAGLEHRRVELSSLASVGIVITALKLDGAAPVFAVLASAGLLTVVSSPAWHRALGAFGSLAAGVVVTAALWHFYGERFLPIWDQLGIHRGGFRLDLVPELLSSAWSVVKTFWLVYALSLVAVAAGVYRLLAGRTLALRPLDFALAVSGLALVGHILIILTAYVGAGFEDWEIAGAHSWQRYVSQVALGTCALALMAGLSRIPWPRRAFNAPQGLRVGICCGVVAIAYAPTAISAAGALHFYALQRLESRTLALAAVAYLPAHARAAVMGDEWSRIFLGYSAWVDVDAARRPWVTEFYEVASREDLPKARARLARWLRDESIDCILILDGADLAASVDLPAVPDLVRCSPDGDWRALELGRRNIHRLM